MQDMGTYGVESKGSTQAMSKRVYLKVKEGVQVRDLEEREPGTR